MLEDKIGNSLTTEKPDLASLGGRIITTWNCIVNQPEAGSNELTAYLQATVDLWRGGLEEFGVDSLTEADANLIKLQKILGDKSEMVKYCTGKEKEALIKALLVEDPHEKVDHLSQADIFRKLRTNIEREQVQKSP